MSKAKRSGKYHRKAVTLSAIPIVWDRGACGPANQERLRIEPATDFDPETGRETPNPNGMKRRRRQSWLRIYEKNLGQDGAALVAAGEKLLMAAEGIKDRDPLAAISGVRSSSICDPQVARLDARAYFFEMWRKIPAASKPVVERVVIDDLPIWHGNASARMRHIQRMIDGLTAIR